MRVVVRGDKRMVISLIDNGKSITLLFCLLYTDDSLQNGASRVKILPVNKYRKYVLRIELRSRGPLEDPLENTERAATRPWFLLRHL